MIVVSQVRGEKTDGSEMEGAVSEKVDDAGPLPRRARSFNAAVSCVLRQVEDLGAVQ